MNSASAQGRVRLFLEEGEAMARLLVPDLPDARRHAQVDALLCVEALTGSSQPGAVPARAPGLPDALTPQEQRVLALLAQGASNREIATALMIGLTTVKSHVSHLLRKLGVTTRIQAIARARELGLL